MMPDILEETRGNDGELKVRRKRRRRWRARRESMEKQRETK